MGNNSLGFLSVFFLLFAFSCDSNRVFEENKSVDVTGWEYTEPVDFTFDIQDTLTTHNLYINVRNTEDYEYSNIFFFWKLTFPNEKTRIDTIEGILADPSGRWLGNGNSLIDTRILFKVKNRFPLAGNYKVSIQQAMRENSLENIANIGFRIEKSY